MQNMVDHWKFEFSQILQNHIQYQLLCSMSYKAHIPS